MSSSILDWQPITTAWLKNRPSILSDVLLPAFESVFPSQFYYLIFNIETKFPYPKLSEFLFHTTFITWS